MKSKRTSGQLVAQQHTAHVPAADDIPGRRATDEELRKANAEILALLDEIERRNLPSAAAFVSSNPPSPWAVAWLARRAHQLFTSSENSWRAQQSRMRDALAGVIDEIMCAKSAASTKEVIEALRERAPGKIIEQVADDGTVTWVNKGELVDTPGNDIAKRVSRTRAKLNQK